MNKLIGKTVTVYDRYLFAVPVKGTIIEVSKKDGAFRVNFSPNNPGGPNVTKHSGKFFHAEQCKIHTVGKRSDKGHRPQIPVTAIEKAKTQVEKNLMLRLKEKGFGAWLSRHEILGLVVEEGQKEVVDVVHSGTAVELKKELSDLAVACIFGIACIEEKTLDW